MSRTRVHTKYQDDMFQELPSVTKVLSIINKPQLLDWAWKCGLKNVDYKKERDTKGGIGTLTHSLILAHLKGEEFDTREFSKDDIDQAETCFIKFLDWERKNPFKVIMAEKPLVSNKYMYGGTLDLCCEIEDKISLIDFKSGKAIYEPEMPAQLSAYDHLLFEQGIICMSWYILRIGREESEGFELRRYDNIQPYFEVFESALNLYHAINKAKGRN